MYTVRNESTEGVYYLINHWNKYKKWFVPHLPQMNDQYFRREQDAKTGITKVISVSDGMYDNDVFTIIKI